MRLRLCFSVNHGRKEWDSRAVKGALNTYRARSSGRQPCARGAANGRSGSGWKNQNRMTFENRNCSFFFFGVLTITSLVILPKLRHSWLGSSFHRELLFSEWRVGDTRTVSRRLVAPPFGGSGCLCSQRLRMRNNAIRILSSSCPFLGGIAHVRPLS